MLSYRWYARTMCHMSWMLLTCLRSFSILNMGRWGDRWKLAAELDWFVRRHLIHLFVAILLLLRHIVLLLNSAILFAGKENGPVSCIIELFGLFYIIYRLSLLLLFDDRVRRDNVESACKQTLLLFDIDVILKLQWRQFILLLVWVKTAIFAILRAWSSYPLWADRSSVTLSRL